MGIEPITVRTSIGRYDWLHPDSDRVLIEIRVGQANLGLLFDPESAGDLVEDGYPWEDLVPDALRRWLSKTLWSEKKPQAQSLLVWAESDEGQKALALAFARYMIRRLTHEIETLRATLSMNEDELERFQGEAARLEAELSRVRDGHASSE